MPASAFVKFAGAATFAGALLAACAIPTPILSPQRTDDIFRHIQPGMTEAEVTQMIGAPDDKTYFSLSGNTGWGYLYYDTWGYMAEFSVTFAPGGVAVSKFSRRFTGGGDQAK